MWCSVDDAEVGEPVYLLVADRSLSRLEQLASAFPLSSIPEVPDGWQLYGPSPLPPIDGLESLGLPVRQATQAVPTLVGGWKSRDVADLVGGPPALRLPGSETNVPIRVDNHLAEFSIGRDLQLNWHHLSLAKVLISLRWGHTLCGSSCMTYCSSQACLRASEGHALEAWCDRTTRGASPCSWEPFAFRQLNATAHSSVPLGVG